MNPELVSQTICYHGLPLQKMWEGERGNNDLQKIGLYHLDYSMYQARQKYLTFQDRAKRLKLHQFISKKAPELFADKLIDQNPKKLILNGKDDSEIVRMPPYEVFLNVDITERQKHFFKTVKAGDIIYGMVMNLNQNGLIVKPICATGSVQRFIGDIGLKALITRYNLTPVANKGSDKYSVNDYVCCEVLEVVPDACKLILGMKGQFPRTDDGPPFGLITTENFPDVYKTAAQTKGRTYNEVLESSPAFKNPLTEELLYEELGLDVKEYYTNMSGMRGRFPEKEYANELRQSQASKWAFRSVAEGIEHFKEGRHSEAFQCLNKALNMDPRNVEGLVARGALYANSGSFKKAVDDFESALKLNSSHANARKYLGETLVALGRSYEEENKVEDARKAYLDCLKVVPNHEEAYNSLEYLKSRFSGKQIVEPNELELPPLNLNKPMDSKLDDKRDDRKDKRNSKKDKKKKSKKRRGSSSESSSSSDSSDSSSTDSSSTDSSSDSDAGSSRHKRKKGKADVSPFSQRMGDFHGGPSDPFAQFGSQQNFGGDDYENKVKKFIEMTRDDDDYEEKVRKFVAEAAKYQRERKDSEAKSKDAKKKKRKDEKKAKKESKKKRKKEKHSKNKRHDLEESENKKLREALKIFEKLPVLDDLGAKLSEIYASKTKAAANEVKPSNSAEAGNNSKKPVNIYEKVPPPSAPEPSKWKMMFPKDSDSTLPPVQTIHVTKLGPVPERLNRFGQTSVQEKLQGPPPEESRVPILPPQARQMRKMPSPLGLYGRNAYGQKSTPPPPPPVKSGPVVLDKFGNFRLANIEPMPGKPPEPSGFPSSRSRSRGRYRGRSRSSSRSRSRSRRRSHGRRSRSRSFPRFQSRGGGMGGRRFGGPSRSRSGSRSRSVSPRRTTFRGRGRGRAMLLGRGRVEVRPPRRFNNNMRFTNRISRSISPLRDRPMSPGDNRRRNSPGRGRNGNSPDRRGRREDSNKSSRFDDKKDVTKKSQDDNKTKKTTDNSKKAGGMDQKKRNDDRGGYGGARGASTSSSNTTKKSDGKDRKEPAPPGTTSDPDFVATEKLLDTARRERKEDMISRNPDLVKRSSEAF